MFEANASGILGLSLDAEGVVGEGEAEGRFGWIVEDISRLNSFDVVTHPAAGGKFEKLVASTKGAKSAMKNFMKLLAAIASRIGQEALEDPKAFAEAVVAHARIKTGSVLKEKLESMLDILVTGGDECETKIDEAISALDASHVLEGIADPEPAPVKKDDEEEDPPKEEDPPEDPPAEDEAAQESKKRDAEFEKRLKALEASVKDEKNRADVAESKAIASAVVSGTTLPQPVKDKLLAEMDGEVLTESDARNRVRREREMLGALAKSGHIVDLGDNSKEGQLKESRDVIDKRVAAISLGLGYVPTDDEKKLFEGVRPARSIREQYIWYTGDENVSGEFDRAKMHGGMRLSESITTATFTYALGTSMNRVLQQEYAAYESPWRQFAMIDRVESFKLQEYIQWGSLGDIATVAEGGTYQEITPASDFRATFTPTKRGGVVTVTREAIINDDLRLLSRLPRMVGRSAARVLEQFVYDLLMNVSGGVINAGTIYDATALYTAGHSNLGAAALDSTSLEAAQQAMFNQTDPGSSEKLGLSPGYLVVPRELRPVALRLQNDERVPEGAENASNTLRGSLAGIIVSSKLRGDANNWYLTARPQEIDTMTIGFVQGQEAPTLIQQNAENVGLAWTNDKLGWKVRHEYGGAVNDYRAFYGAIVA